MGKGGGLKHFWNSRPSPFLLLAIAGDLVVVFLISVFGLPGIAPITPAAALSVVVLSVMVVCLINDTVKAALVKRFWQQL